MKLLARLKRSKILLVWQLIRWICTDALRQHLKHAIIFITLSTAAIGIQLGAFMVAAKYASLLESNGIFNKFGFNIVARDSVELLFFTSLVVSLALSLSAAINYFARRLAQTLAMQYENTCRGNVVDASHQLPILACENAAPLNQTSYLLRLANKDARACGTVLRISLIALFPLSMLIIGFCALLYLNAELTLILCATAPLMLGGYLHITRNTVKKAYNIENDNQNNTRSLAQYFQSENPLIDYADTADILKTQITSPQRVQDTRLKTVEQIRLLSQTSTALVLLVVVLFYGLSALQGQTNITNLVIFLFFLRYTMGHFMTLAIQSSRLSVIYPSIKRFKDFSFIIKSLDATTQPATQSLKLTYRDCFDFSKQSVQLTPSTKVVLIGKGGFKRHQLSSLTGTISGHSPFSYQSVECNNEGKLNFKEQIPGHFEYLDLDTLDSNKILTSEEFSAIGLFDTRDRVIGGDLQNMLQHREQLFSSVLARPDADFENDDIDDSEFE